MEQIWNFLKISFSKIKKTPDLSHLGPIWPNLGQNLATLSCNRVVCRLADAKAGKINANNIEKMQDLELVLCSSQNAIYHYSHLFGKALQND